MFESLYSLLVVALLAMAAYGVGRPLWAILRLAEDDNLATTVWSCALGLIVWGTAIAILGYCGQLRPWILALLTVPAAGWGIGEVLASGLQNALASLVDPLGEDEDGRRRPAVVWALTIAAGVVLVASCVTALAPPTAVDAVSYHLEVPKRFLLEQRIVELPDIGRPASPLLAEMWYLWALALDGPVAAQLVHWSLGLLLAAAAVVLARPVVGREWRWAVGAVVLLIPGVQHEMVAPLNDLALGVMTTLAAVAWWRAVVRADDPRWFIALGIALGGAMSIRHAGLLFGLAVVSVTIGFVLRRPVPWRVALSALAMTLASLLTVVSCWYLRAAWTHGNFLLALARTFFDPHVTLPTAATLPWQLTMRPEQFGGSAWQLGPLFLLVLPGLLVARRLRGLAPLLILAMAYVVCWAMACGDVRRLLPCVPPLALGVVWVWHEWRRLPRPALAIVGLASSLVILASVVGALVPVGRVLPVVMGLEDRRDYLLRTEPTFGTALLTQDLIGRQVHVLSQDPRAFYFRCRVTSESAYRARTHYDEQSGAITRRLREAGFTHVLLTDEPAESPASPDDRLAKLLEADGLERPAAAPICLSDTIFPDPAGPRRYRLLMLR